MKIEYLHASKFGNGATVAAEFERVMAARDVVVEVHHIREVKPAELSPADVYLFSSPGRMGRPIGAMRRFLKKVELPVGTRYAILSTEMAPKPDKKTGKMPTEAEVAEWQHIRPVMNETLQGKGLVSIAEDVVHVTGLKGPLEGGWHHKVDAFANRVLTSASGSTHPDRGPSAASRR
jgi:menaquinone-dependent protoporphyrinogen IX oxidase